MDDADVADPTCALCGRLYNAHGLCPYCDYCATCGSELDASTDYCRECGWPDWEETPADATDPRPRDRAPAAHLARRDDGWAVLLYREDGEFPAEERFFPTRAEAEDWLTEWNRLGRRAADDGTDDGTEGH